ncbi:MAG: zinc ribbon domain-containing protein [Actinomycetota bacterium]
MISCPHCGAENADGSEFCTLCLATFRPRGAPSVGAGQQTAPTPAAAGTQPPAQAYVSPGDYRAYAQEAARQAPQPSFGGAGHYVPAAQRGGAAGAIVPAARGLSMGKTDLALLLLAYSFLTFLTLFASRFIISIALLGAAFGGSEAGFSIGVAVLFISDALILAAGGMMASAKARQVGWGWMVGAGCAACTVLLWQPLASLALILLFTGEVYVPLFTLVGVLVALFLEIPMGALGGWIAEKRSYG